MKFRRVVEYYGKDIVVLERLMVVTLQPSKNILGTSTGP